MVRRQDEGMREAHGTYNITLGLKKSLKKLIVWTKLPEPHIYFELEKDTVELL